jgi:hypothetical protein
MLSHNGGSTPKPKESRDREICDLLALFIPSIIRLRPVFENRGHKLSLAAHHLAQTELAV